MIRLIKVTDTREIPWPGYWIVNNVNLDIPDGFIRLPPNVPIDLVERFLDKLCQTDMAPETQRTGDEVI